MLRKVLGTVLLLGALAGCTAPLRVCESDADCSGGGVCDLERKLCFSASAEGGACEPACSAVEACTLSNVCVPRYTGLELTPLGGSVLGAGPVAVQARLSVGTGFAEIFPETLTFSVEASDGGPGGSLGTVTGSGGVYTTQWRPPGEGEFLLTAAYPEVGVPSAMVRLSVDTTGPSFAVFVPPADAGVADGGTTYADPEPGFATAWRRDQVVPVEIRTNEPHLDVGSVTVTLVGTDGGSAPAVAVTPLSGACDAGFCGVAQLNLREPPFDAFRSTMTVNVQGEDTVGNAGSGAATVNVTRWKWAFDVQTGVIKSTPAISQQGLIYFGTTTGTDGKLFALNPDGPKQWETVTGVVVSGPTVGASNSGVENVYVGVNPSSTLASLVAFNGSTGAEVVRCDVNKGQIASSLVLTQISTGGTSVETALGVVNVNVGGPTGIVGALLAIRPEGAATVCNSTDPIARSQVNSSGVGPLVIEGDTVFFADASGRMTSYQLGSTTARSGWPVSTNFPINALALVGSDVVGANGGSFSDQGQLFSIPKIGGVASPPWRYPSTTDMFINQLSVGSANVVFFGSENLPNPPGSAGLAAVPLGGNTLNTLQAGVGSFKGAPVIGRGGVLYAATEGTGLVGEWSTDDFSNHWTLASGIGPTSISPALDCARDGAGVARAENLGVLYVPAGGKLYAFVVDSRGLDTSAPWPKYQHDSRNTGNPATPITSCP
ncbi:PQQ-binding-like beta-propeller repeat protein [Archangium gephyra]|uniref:PQQ-binding-like beta-propeller repeat protein n=1 Tax=Archangium gephyra TaxID=48 RepID=UPI003B810A9E